MEKENWINYVGKGRSMHPLLRVQHHVLNKELNLVGIEN